MFNIIKLHCKRGMYPYKSNSNVKRKLKSGMVVCSFKCNLNINLYCSNNLLVLNLFTNSNNQKCIFARNLSCKNKNQLFFVCLPVNTVYIVD